MNIPIEQFVPTGASLIATISGLVGMWFKFMNKVERPEEEKGEMKRQINAFWHWKDDYEKVASSNREKIYHDIARLDAAGLVVNEQLKNIVLILQEIKNEISEFKRNERS